MRSVGSTITLHMTINGAFYGILVLNCVQLWLRINAFFFIEECIDPRVAREKENIAVIHAVQGRATAKQIEQQFMYLAGSSTWKWNARQVGENRFVMRFPNAKMIMDWGHIKAFAMNDVDAFLKVEQWSPKLGAKGMLQQAWFGVKDIP